MFNWLKNLSWANIIGYDDPKRARTKRGRYKGDDKSTKNVNEAWVGGKAPKKEVYKINGKRYTKKKRITKKK
jgi:hypothetical protein